jgi:hypothetical protein
MVKYLATNQIRVINVGSLCRPIVRFRRLIGFEFIIFKPEQSVDVSVGVMLRQLAC